MALALHVLGRQELRKRIKTYEARARENVDRMARGNASYIKFPTSVKAIEATSKFSPQIHANVASISLASIELIGCMTTAGHLRRTATPHTGDFFYTRRGGYWGRIRPRPRFGWPGVAVHIEVHKARKLLTSMVATRMSTEVRRLWQLETQNLNHDTCCHEYCKTTATRKVR